jgi:hypothetical protein
MSVTAADIKHYKSTTMAADFTTSNIGGAPNTGAQIQGAVLSEVLYTMASATAGGGAKVQYSSTHVKNTNATDALTSAKVWLANGLDDVASAGTASFASSSASDDSTRKVRILGLDDDGVPTQEEVTLNGTATATSLTSWSVIHRVELRLVSGGTLVNSDGDITITRGSALGVIPAGYWSATAEVQFGVEATLGTSTTTADAATAPGGISFAKPRTEAGAASLANSGTVAAAATQQVWWQWTMAEQAKPSADVQVVLRWSGETA